MIAIVSLLMIIMLSILVTRIATIALIHTGMTREVARFQARSAFTGAGFTTRESEQVTNHPVRRRIIMILMLSGNAGIVTIMSSLILSFVGPTERSLSLKLVLLLGGLGLLWFIANSKWVDRHLSRAIDKALRKYTKLDVRDYSSLMHLAGDYRLVELLISPDDWIANRTLQDAELRDEGLVVLGIKRENGPYIGGPKGDSLILPGDTLLVYGRIKNVEELDSRTKDWTGDQEHRERVRKEEEAENADTPRPAGSA